MQQLSLFDNPIFKINKPIRLIELFAGIGSQAKALKRIGADFEHYRVCEFDKYAVNSYNAIHGTNFVTSDITQLKATDLGIVDTEKYCYIMTYSFPCQDLSLAGKQKGMAKGENTRSGLLWEVERILNECTELPQVLLMENVTQVHGKKNKEHFEKWIEFLESKGYSNYWQDLNAKNFGIPQNRNRCFMVSLLGNYSYKFPEEFPLTLRLKDMLEDAVDEKYYLGERTLNYFIENTKKQQAKGNGFKFSTTDGETIAKAITTKSGSRMDDIFIEESNNNHINMLGLLDIKGNEQVRRVYGTDGISPTLNTMQGGHRQPKVLVETLAVWDGFNQRVRADSTVVGTLTTNCGADLKRNGQGINEAETHRVIEPVCINSKGGRNGIEGLQPSLQDRVYDSNAISTAVTTCFMPSFTDGMRIRKLTPKECWRLMGFDDADFEKAAQLNSNAQLYKQAGNSIVVDVLTHIFKSLL